MDTYEKIAFTVIMLLILAVMWFPIQESKRIQELNITVNGIDTSSLENGDVLFADPGEIGFPSYSDGYIIEIGDDGELLVLIGKDFETETFIKAVSDEDLEVGTRVRAIGARGNLVLVVDADNI